MSLCKHDLTATTCADCLHLIHDADEFQNFEDWFLNDASTDTRPGWRSGDVVVKEMEAAEAETWTPALVASEDLMDASDASAGCRKHGTEQSPGVRGGGLFGLDPTYHAVRAGLVALGRAS